MKTKKSRTREEIGLKFIVQSSYINSQIKNNQ
nr:MAG TPA: hypothetical protein [Caudoviricetes sp.]